jgi:XTP/dITP diphosphohydrolase
MKEASLLLATTNRGKLKELTGLLSGLPIRLISLLDLNGAPDVAETAETFKENALLKARAYSAFCDSWTLADDSGLEIEALGNRPGVYSARYAGHDASYAERIAKLLEELNQTGDRERRARFSCVVALVGPVSGQIHTFYGECRGTIAHSPRGSGGFGYDPIFLPEGHGQTFAELSEKAKQDLSHRGRAVVKAREFLGGILQAGLTAGDLVSRIQLD